MKQVFVKSQEAQASMKHCDWALLQFEAPADQYLSTAQIGFAIMIGRCETAAIHKPRAKIRNSRGSKSRSSGNIRFLLRYLHKQTFLLVIEKGLLNHKHTIS